MSFEEMRGYGRGNDAGGTADSRPFWPLRRVLRPLRRTLAWAALVDEERSLRMQAVASVADLRAGLEDDVASIAGVLGSLDRRLVELEERTIRRVDALVSEAVHRSEVRDARLAGELTRIAEQLADQEYERTAILRELAGPTQNATGDGSAPTTSSASRPAPGSANWRVPSWYRIFAAIERGSREEVAAGFRMYLPLYEGISLPVVDLGCGRGEFLELAGEAGIPAYGVDLSGEAVTTCAGLGLRAVEDDLFDHLAARPPASLGGAFCAQVVEHLDADDVLRFFELLAPAMATQAVAVVETPNPASFAVHVHSFWRDPTHLRPVPPPLLCFAARRAGLVVEATAYSAPLPEEHRLAGVDIDPDAVDLRLVVKRYNETIEVLNDLLFGPQNYAVVLRKTDA